MCCSICVKIIEIHAPSDLKGGEGAVTFLLEKNTHSQSAPVLKPGYKMHSNCSKNKMDNETVRNPEIVELKPCILYDLDQHSSKQTNK